MFVKIFSAWPLLKPIPQELSHLTNSFAQLKQAQAKFLSCIDSAKEVKPENKGMPGKPWATHEVDPAIGDKTILVPLTGSLYVPGKLQDVENVMIDVGTGYYVQKVRILRYDLTWTLG